MAEKVVTLEWPAEHVALITYSDPARNNHLSWICGEQLAGAAVEARERGAKVVVLASGAPGYWIQHAWIPDMVKTFTGKGAEASGNPAAIFTLLQEIKGPMIWIAAINGDTSGGGCEIGWTCDLRVAEEQVYLGQPEVQMGVGTGIGGSSRLARLIGRTITAEIVLDGAPMSAQRLYELGGVNRVAPQGQGVTMAVDWARRIAGNRREALEGMKRMLEEGGDLPLNAAVENDQKIFQTFSTDATALEMIQKIQARFEAGETTRDTYGHPHGHPHKA